MLFPMSPNTVIVLWHEGHEDSDTLGLGSFIIDSPGASGLKSCSLVQVLAMTNV